MVNYLALLIALILSAVAAYYSIIGLTTIFVSAFIPIVIMGSSLEAAKVVAVSWVYRNWHTAPILIKYYLVTAIAVLMLITSMGTFGYLSKAHMDQAVPTGSVQDRLNIVDEKIRIAKENIDVNRKALKQMDEAVDQVMGRSSDEKGADKAVVLRRSQQKERARIFVEIEAEQKKLSVLSEERIPLANDLRKITSEVGPIKYIAELMYDQASDDILDKAVRWVIILIVAVFDPLAIVLLIAANQGLYGSQKEKVQLSNPDMPEITSFGIEETPPKVKIPSWFNRTSELINKRKKGIIEIDKNAVMKMK
jgi:hypothetical protein